MDLSSILSGFGGDFGKNFQDVTQGLQGLYGSYQGMNNSGQLNSQIQSGLGQNQGALQNQLSTLQAQQAQAQQQAQDMYQRSLGDVTTQNSALQGNIGNLTTQLNALSDPNSAYMQNARQAIERKDAAAGRNSQWGDRETQLAGTLAQYVGQYAPGLQNSITGATNQINQNNQGLASLYNTAQMPSDRNMAEQIAAIQQQISNSNALNQAGRQAGTAATNSQLGMIGAGAKALGGLGSMLGGSSGGTGNWLSSLFGGGTSVAGNGNLMGPPNPSTGLMPGYDFYNQGQTMGPANPYETQSSYQDVPNSLDDAGIW